MCTALPLAWAQMGAFSDFKLSLPALVSMSQQAIDFLVELGIDYFRYSFAQFSGISLGQCAFDQKLDFMIPKMLHDLCNSAISAPVGELFAHFGPHKIGGYRLYCGLDFRLRKIDFEFHA